MSIFKDFDKVDWTFFLVIAFFVLLWIVIFARMVVDEIHSDYHQDRLVIISVDTRNINLYTYIKLIN